MTQERQPNDIKTKALPVLHEIFSTQRLYRGKIAVTKLVEDFGISEEEAITLVRQFVEARQMNKLPGATLKLPEPRKLSPEAPITELERGSAHFVLAYSEEVLGIEQQYPLGLFYWGRWWLGNTEGETKTLVGWMQQNPDKVADYLNWTFGQPNNPHPYAKELRVRAKEGKLKEPKFE